jgi:hypothetical protein
MEMPDMILLTDRHKDIINGTVSCFDRIVINGTIPGICYSQGITSYFYSNGIRIFDFPNWAKPLRDEIHENAKKIAVQNDLEIEFIKKFKDFRKEVKIKEIIKQRGDHPGLVHIFSAMETCNTYKPWHDKTTKRTFLKYDTGRCLHYYFYFIDSDLGLCYLRIPTWVPFRLQFYFNGHNALANKLQQKNIAFKMAENAFISIDDFNIAQKLADDIDTENLHRKLNQAAYEYCPVIQHFPQGYHWSIMQAEYATDIIFKRQVDLAPIYEDLVRTTVHAVKPLNIAMFLGRKLDSRYDDELGNRFSTRIEGKCIKHHMGKTGIKMYDKFGLVLRIETTTNDVSFFKHYRRVEHRDGTSSMKQAAMRKTIYSLPDLLSIMKASNRRYLEFISAIEDPTNGIVNVQRITRKIHKNGRSYRGFNLFNEEDEKILQLLARGEFQIYGFRSKDLRRHVQYMKSWKISHILRRLRNHGIIKKAGKSYKYYLTALGKKAVSASLKLKEMFLIPYLRGVLVDA